ncbi:uncharacterized protein LOC119556512 isoform X2 [Drosophila subpulchrella]|nr:uncharacterized protein LOC119556512 isoform X2 [Drosophila subpulchrella]XP_037724708.1 uncharacterized protein LOC119556512 isoform X2 [Drosophila subpulchrella]
MSMTPNTSALTEGRDIAIKTREAVICLTQEWLEHMKNDVLKEAIRKYSYHKLYLKHPLEAEVEKVVFNYETEAFEYIDAEPVNTVEEEMPKIIETLLVVEHLFEEIKFSHKDWNCYFKSFVYFFHHNMHSALRIANQSELCNPGDSQYNKNHIFLNFAAALETIKVLTVMVHKYDQLISNQ